MDKNQMKKEINILKSKYKLLNLVELNDKEDYEWLLVEVRSKLAGLNAKVTEYNFLAVFIATCALLFTLVFQHLSNDDKDLNNLVISIIGVIVVIYVTFFIRAVPKSEKKRIKIIQELSKLENYIEFYLKRKL